MNGILRGTYKGKQYRLKVECYSKPPAIKVQLIPTDESDRITVTQDIGQSLPRYQAYLGEDILDVDSFDITDPDTGERFECTVGISEFLAPELQGRDLRKAKFTKHTDEFALAVHIFQLLMGNAHPFNVKVVDSVKQSLPENKLEMNIVNGNCPWVKATL